MILSKSRIGNESFSLTQKMLLSITAMLHLTVMYLKLMLLARIGSQEQFSVCVYVVTEDVLHMYS